MNFEAHLVTHCSSIGLNLRDVNVVMISFGASDVKKSRAIAIDLTGAALVYDDRTETIVRFK